VPNSDSRRFGIGNGLLGLSDESPQSEQPISRLLEQTFLQQLKK
jgi:hypothetical protein